MQDFFGHILLVIEINLYSIIDTIRSRELFFEWTIRECYITKWQTDIYYH